MFVNPRGREVATALERDGQALEFLHGRGDLLAGYVAVVGTSDRFNGAPIRRNGLHGDVKLGLLELRGWKRNSVRLAVFLECWRRYKRTR